MENEQKERLTNFDVLKNINAVVLDSETLYLNQNISIVLSDLKYLSQSFLPQIVNKEWDSMASNLKKFSQTRGLYDQVRFIDTVGKEKVRINLYDSGAKIVPQDELQDKGERYYFKDAIDLSENVFSMTPLDLNIEHNGIEIPYKPIIRVSIPIYKDGVKYGVFVLNFKASLMLKMFANFGVRALGDIQLVNSEGYWLSNKDSDKEWGFMFPDKKDVSFANEFSTEWGKILQGDTNFITKNGIFSAQKVSYRGGLFASITSHTTLQVQSSTCWYIVLHIKNEGIYKDSFQYSFFSMLLYVLKIHLALFIVLLIIVLIIARGLTLHFDKIEDVTYKAQFDEMSGAYNRRTGELYIQKKVRFSSKTNPFSICFTDINGLKLVNDTLGHIAGDELIVAVTKAISAELREGDKLARFGGDEFVIMFNGDMDGTEKLWLRVQNTFDKINREENRNYLISVSHGVSECIQYVDMEDFLHSADEKMYTEKEKIKQTVTILRSKDSE